MTATGANDPSGLPPDAADLSRWRASGPDADNPPWAGSSKDEPPEDPDDEPADDGDEDEEDGQEVPHAAQRPMSTALDVPTGAKQLPRPPKRTGIFLDPEDLREHVGGLLRAFLGGYEVDAWGNFTFVHEDARIFVTVGSSPIGPQVGVFSITNLDVELSPKLSSFLLTTNHKLGFGSFSYDPENEAVWLRHTLLGTTLDGPELQSAVVAVASTAAHFDDIIRDSFGGRAFHDAPEDVQRRAKPPETQEQHAASAPNASGYL